MKKVFVVILGLGMGLTMMAQAQKKDCNAHKGQCHKFKTETVEERATHQADMLRDSLSLTKKQYQKAYQMYLNRYKAMDEKMAQMRQQRLANPQHRGVCPGHKGACPGHKGACPEHCFHGAKAVKDSVK